MKFALLSSIVSQPIVGRKESNSKWLRERERESLSFQQKPRLLGQWNVPDWFRAQD
jgi:hypothetical protein